MKIVLGQTTIRLIGDPHLGRKFEVGVPLSRKGDREIDVIRDFKNRVAATDSDLTICMGDLFDKYVVLPEVELAAIEAYDESTVPQFVLMGNHDGSRDARKSSSFEVFARAVCENTTVVEGVPHFHPLKDGSYIILLPWNAFTNAEEMAKLALETWNQMKRPTVSAVFGHWDLEDFSDFGADTSNLVPVKTLRQITKKIYTGHVHKATSKIVADVEIISTGSMQPYAHGEEHGTTVYETLTLTELRQRDPASLKNKCLRVTLEDGEELPNDIDCLQLTRHYVKKKVDDGVEEEVRIEQFDLKRLLEEALNGRKVPETIRVPIRGKFEEMK